MSWQSLGTFQLIPFWQFTPPTDAVVFRVTQTNFDRLNKAFLAQVGQQGEYYDIRALFPTSEPQLLYYPNPPLASFRPRSIAVRAKDYKLTNWTIQLDYMPLSSTDDFFGSSRHISTEAITTVVPASTTSVTLLDANPDRKGFKIFNTSNSKLHINYGTSATVNGAAVILNSNQLLELNEEYVGQVSGIWLTANGNARVTEFV